MLLQIPLAPLEKVGITFKVPLEKGDLGGSVLFQRVIKYFSNILLEGLDFKNANEFLDRS